MEKLNGIVQRYWPVALAGTFLVGIVIGLVVLGWGLWPVQWTDASPADLQDEYQRTYLLMAADSYAQNGDADLARQRLQVLEAPSQTSADIGAKLESMAQAQSEADDAEAATRLRALGAMLVANPETGTQPAPATQSTVLARLLRVCGLVVLVLVILAGLLLLVYFLQSRTSGGAQVERRVEGRVAPAASSASNGSRASPAVPAIAPEPAAATPPPSSPTVVGDVPPLATAPEVAAIGPFVATYSLGDVDFDMSFGIESPSGDFLGECGLGMAEVIGGGDVQRVTAFEVWLFDKTDIRTVSLVLASAHAHADPALRTKLASRGEVVLAQPGARFSVSTSTLRLDGQILDLAYGGGDVPAQSYYTSFSVELVPVLLEEDVEQQ